jgi:uncharacterized protein with GYD domain
LHRKNPVLAAAPAPSENVAETPTPQRISKENAMKYVLVGTLDAKWIGKQKVRTKAARAQAKKLGIKIESVYYTQGIHDFVDVAEGKPDAMLAFSLWYAKKGFGRITTLPAFDEKSMAKADRNA